MPAVVLTTAVPSYASLEEHLTTVSSTPTSFADIPPVLRHKQDNVRVKLDPPVDGFTDSDTAQGTLYVIDSALVFMSSTGRGFQIAYPSITLHAISRGENGPSIYCQLDDNTQDNGGAAAEDNNDDEDTEMRELSILPADHQSLENIFEALSFCASLHPDPANGKDDDDDDDDDDAFINGAEQQTSPFDTFSGDETQELSEVGRAALAHLESIIYDPNDLTKDASVADHDEDEEEDEEDAVVDNQKNSDDDKKVPSPTTADPQVNKTESTV